MPILLTLYEETFQDINKHMLFIKISLPLTSPDLSSIDDSFMSQSLLCSLQNNFPTPPLSPQLPVWHCALGPSFSPLTPGFLFLVLICHHLLLMHKMPHIGPNFSICFQILDVNFAAVRELFEFRTF